MSSTAWTFEPFMMAFTHFLLTLNPIGPSIPPSVKSRSPNSLWASFPSMKMVNPTFFSWFPQSIFPTSDRGWLLLMCPFPSAFIGADISLYPLGTTAVREGNRGRIECPICSAHLYPSPFDPVLGYERPPVHIISFLHVYMLPSAHSILNPAEISFTSLLHRISAPASVAALVSASTTSDAR